MKKRPWLIVSLIFFITFVNFIDRSAISFVIEPLKKEFHFTDTEFGLILSAFGFGYLFLTGIGGWLVDKFGSSIIWPVAAIAWSLCLGTLSLATGLWSFVVLRFLLGVAEGPHYPAVSCTVNNFLPSQIRAKALSFSLAAIPISSAIGAPITSYLAANFGWRQMFIIISLAGILWGIVWYYFFKGFSEKHTHKQTKEESILPLFPAKKVATDWRFILFNRTLLANNLSYFAFGYMVFFATLWLPGYLSFQFGLNLKSIGWYLTLPWLAASLFLPLGGYISHWLYKKTKSFRIAHSHVLWISQLLTGLCFLSLSINHSLPVTLFLLSLGVGFGFMPLAIFFHVNIEVASRHIGAAQGITSSIFSLSGIIAPAITGWLVDLTGNFQTAFFLLGILSALGVLIVIFFHNVEKKLPNEHFLLPLLLAVWRKLDF
ncbi:MAG: MFS transporter [Chlamydiota bacterium]